MVGMTVADEEFNRALELLAEENNGAVLDMMKDRAAKLLRNLAYKTPYKTGKGKGGWLNAVKGIGARIYVGKRPNNNGKYRETEQPGMVSIDLINSWSHLYIQNYGFTGTRADGTTYTVDKHKGWFDDAIIDNAQYQLRKWKTGLRKRGIKF